MYILYVYIKYIYPIYISIILSIIYIHYLIPQLITLIGRHLHGLPQQEPQLSRIQSYALTQEIIIVHNDTRIERVLHHCEVHHPVDEIGNS
jgi:hypothetical protein